ncbi:MAG TPA: GNAT family N-acetyltransferase [Acidimicrobiia bacterium]|nr:GNAT family N-acetyltransferase [Acidimicrobiia bacterium]
MSDAVRITNNESAHRYEAWVGDDLAGLITYRLQPGRIVLVHTETEEGFERQGIGSELAAWALNDARTRGLGVTPFCPFVASYIRHHPEYADLVVRET